MTSTCVCIQCGWMFDSQEIGISDYCPSCLDYYLSEELTCANCEGKYKKDEQGSDLNYCYGCKTMMEFGEKILKSQTDCPPEFLKVINDNIEELLA